MGRLPKANPFEIPRSGPLEEARRTEFLDGKHFFDVFFELWAHFVPFLNATPQHFAIIGIAAFFASVVRATLTGIILAIELTDSFSCFLPMLAATFGAVTVASLAKCPPIYESLREAH